MPQTKYGQPFVRGVCRHRLSERQSPDSRRGIRQLGDWRSRCCHPILERVLQRKLNQTRIHRRGCNLSESRLGHIYHGRIAELRVVERIEKFSPELQCGVFPNASNLGRLGQRHIPIELPWTKDNSRRRISPAGSVCARIVRDRTWVRGSIKSRCIKPSAQPLFCGSRRCRHGCVGARAEFRRGKAVRGAAKAENRTASIIDGG